MALFLAVGCERQFVWGCATAEDSTLPAGLPWGDNPHVATKSRRMAVVLLTLACLAIPAPPAAVAQPALNTIFVRANQVGYQPQDTKIGIAFSEAALPDSFAVVRAGSGIAAFQGKTKPVTGVRWGRFENDAELDFSALRAPGRYFLRVGDSKSLPFAISAGAYRELPDQLLEFMREQRCGYNPWLDAVCHPFDGRTAYGPLGERNPYRIGVPFIWCSDNLAVALATQCLLYERMTGDDSYRDFAARQRDWLLDAIRGATRCSPGLAACTRKTRT